MAKRTHPQVKAAEKDKAATDFYFKLAGKRTHGLAPEEIAAQQPECAPFTEWMAVSDAARDLYIAACGEEALVAALSEIRRQRKNARQRFERNWKDAKALEIKRYEAKIASTVSEFQRDVIVTFGPEFEGKAEVYWQGIDGWPDITTALEPCIAMWLIEEKGAPFAKGDSPMDVISEGQAVRAIRQEMVSCNFEATKLLGRDDIEVKISRRRDWYMKHVEKTYHIEWKGACEPKFEYGWEHFRYAHASTFAKVVEAARVLIERGEAVAAGQKKDAERRAQMEGAPLSQRMSVSPYNKQKSAAEELSNLSPAKLIEDASKKGGEES